MYIYSAITVTLAFAANALGVGDGLVETARFEISTQPDATGEIISIVSKENRATVRATREFAKGTLASAFESPIGLGIVFSIKSERDNEILIVDLEDGSTIKTVRCFSYSPSPEGEYVVYERFFPRFTPPEYIRPAVMLLDLTEQGAREQLLHPSTEEQTKGPGGTVNWPISPFLWSTDCKLVLYFNTVSPYGTWDEWQLQMIVARHAEKQKRWAVKVIELDKMAFMKEGTPVEKARLLVGEMQWLRPEVFRCTRYDVMDQSSVSALSFTMSIDGDLLSLDNAH